MLDFWQWNFWTWAWLLWAISFVVIEIPAAWQTYHGHPGATLSEHIWDWLGRNRPLSLAVRIRRILALAFWVWLTAHFFFHFA